MSDAAQIAALKQRAKAGDAAALQALRDLGFFAAKKAVEDGWPLSAAQRRLWIVDRLMPGLPLYNIATALRLDGPLHVAALRGALQALVERHETLRTTFVERAGEPRQHVNSAGSFSLREVDVSGAADPDAAAQAQAAEEAATPFDLACGPLFRATLVKLGAERHLLLCTLHHIVSDAWSAGVLSRELAALYGAGVADRPNPLPPLAVQYRDFAREQNRVLEGEAAHRHREAWLRKLGGERVVLALPTDFPRPALQTSAGQTHAFALGRELSAALVRVGQAQGATPFMTLLALVKALLARYTGQEDILVGSPVGGRERVEWEGLIGFFVNTLVLRDRVARTESFSQLLGRVRETCVEAFEHQAYPFDRLVDDLKLERDFSRSPLFDVSMQLLHAPDGGGRIEGLALSEYNHGLSPAKCDLSFDFTQGAEAFHGTITYRTDLFTAARIGRLAGHLRLLAEQIVAAPTRPLGEHELVTAEERRQILTEFNPAPTPARADTLVGWFERVAAAQPEAVALRDSAAKPHGRDAHATHTLSYGELNARANRLAHVLRGRGVRREAMVAVLLERGAEGPGAMLAVMKGGGVYLPLDPAQPRARLEAMLADSGAQWVIVSRALRDRLPAAFAAGILTLEDLADELAAAPTSALADGPSPADGAYLIYTSGSTGVPKGVLVEHRGVVNTMQDQIARLRLTPADRLLQFASASFDASQFEIWNALLSGATLVLAPTEALADARAFLALLRDEGVTVAVLPPSFVRSLERAELPLRVLFTAGEAASPEDARHYAARLTYVNGYGPTEASICSTVHVVTADEPAPFGVPIGRPLANTRAYLLDAGGRLVPVGVPGELWVGGAGVARGYWRRPELTAERFMSDPFVATPGARMYRTGDLARWREDGVLEFLGRADAQVKLRGFRIEPGEIETALAGCAGVREAAVLLREDRPGQPMLVAYVASAEGATAADTLRAHLRERLPDYMVPSAFVLLPALPVTTAGKVDRRALPAPQWEQAAHVAPRDELEQAVAGIFRDLLRLERVGAHDGFFQIGGNSLLAIQAISRVRDTFKAEVAVPQFFERPTVAGLAATLRADPATRERVEKVARTLARLAALSPEEKQRLLAAKRAGEAAAKPEAARP